MKTLTAVTIAAALSFSGAAFANADLAKKDGCVACHDVSAKKIGPTWKEVAAKLKGNKNAENIIKEALAKGSKGVYGGKIPMPPQPRAAGDADALAKWILSN
jgi:cytochrome c